MKFFEIGLAFAAGTIGYFLPLEGLTEASQLCLSLFLFAGTLWVTEAIPPFATGIVVIVFSIFFLGRPGGPLGLDAGGPHSYSIFLEPFANPTMVLFFAGFILQVAAVKHGFDVRMARIIMKPFRGNANLIVMGTIGTTALFSMFMSNTATTAMMISVMAPVLAEARRRPAFAKAIALAVPFAANIGGLGTIIGSPPNAVAVSILLDRGIEITFFRWMVVCVPLMSVLLLVLWGLLIFTFRPASDVSEIKFPKRKPITWDLITVVITFTATIVLWLTGPLHGVSAPVVALLPVLVFTTTGIIDREDLNRIEWNVLILIAGGMSLGVAMTETGLAQLLVGLIPETLPPLTILILLIVSTVLLSNFMSNTAAANLVLPIVLAIASIDPRLAGMSIAIGASLAMSLPVSTPPNAIAYATNTLTTSDLAKYGSAISVVGVGLLLAGMWSLRALGMV